MGDIDVDYFLPVTMAQLTCRVVTTTDTILETSSRETLDWVAQFITQADRTAPRRLTLRSGAVFDYSMSLTLTEDGRLTSADVESTGQAGKVLSAAVTLASVAAAVAGAPVPVITTATVGTILGAGDSLRNIIGFRGDGDLQWDADPVDERYRQDHPDEARRLKHLLETIDALRATINDLRDPNTTESSNTYQVAQRYELLTKMLSDAKAELAEAEAAKAAWRAGTFKAKTEVFDLVVPISSLPTLSHGTLSFPAVPEHASLEALYEQAGTIVAIPGDPTGAALAIAADNPISYPSADSIHVRQPRQVELVTVVKDGGLPRVTEHHRELMVDDASRELTVQTRRSLWGKRKLNLKLTELGALSELTLNGESSAAAAVGAATGSIDAAKTALGNVAAAQSSATSLQAAIALSRLQHQLTEAKIRLFQLGPRATKADKDGVARLEALVKELAPPAVDGG